MQGRRTAFSGQALCPAKYLFKKETGYLDEKKSVSAWDEAKGEGR